MDVIKYQDSKAYIFQEVRIGRATYSPFVLSTAKKPEPFMPDNELKKIAPSISNIYLESNDFSSLKADAEHRLFNWIRNIIGERFYYVDVFEARTILSKMPNGAFIVVFGENGKSINFKRSMEETERIEKISGCLPLSVIKFQSDSVNYTKEELYIPITSKFDKNPPVYLEGKRYQFYNVLINMIADQFQCKTK